MEKNPLIGVSIIAVVLLILGSLSNVVGYQIVESSNLHSMVEPYQTSNFECDCDSGTLGDSLCDFPLFCAIVRVLFKIVFNMPSPLAVPPLLLFFIFLGAIFDCNWSFSR